MEKGPVQKVFNITNAKLKFFVGSEMYRIIKYIKFGEILNESQCVT